jgi:hypothetical protein
MVIWILSNLKTKTMLRKLKTKTGIFVILLVLALGAGGFAWYRTTREPADRPADVNFGPPSEADKEDAERHKEELAKTPPTTPPTSGKKAVTPITTSWGQADGSFELAARVPGVFEAGGQCTLRMTKGGTTVTGNSTGIENVSETSCGFIKIPLSKLSPGTWQASVTYASQAAQGTSQSTEVTVK